uniref:peptidylprolyl isomerase n=1 Tax=Erycina pusilla TaxID=154679 RepID=A0A0F6PKU1_9ASPA|nr:FKBP13 [Erycina pusilla]
MSSTSTLPASAAYTAHNLQLKLRKQNSQIKQFFQFISLRTKPRPQKPYIFFASLLSTRRKTSFALTGFFQASFLDLFSLFVPSSVLAEQDCTLTVCASGLAFCDRIVGSGTEATKGLLIKAHYVGRLENGKVFDSSYDRGKPITFRVGVGEVIKGWDQGILGGEGIPPMLAGGKRTLKLPPELGYGMRGAGCKGGTCIIPPDSSLLFDVEFIGKA